MSANIITIIRGDTHEFNLTIDNNGEPYVLLPGDAVYFGVMEPNDLFEDSIIKKSTFDEIYYDEVGNYGVTLTTEDTESLLPGLYYYSVKLQLHHEDPDNPGQVIDKVYTIINKTKFIIIE